MYLALSQNTVGAIEVPIISVVANKYDEVVKVITNTNHVYNTGVMMASKRNLDSLDKKYQEAIRQAALEMTPDWRQTVGEASAQAAQDPCREGPQDGRSRPGRLSQGAGAGLSATTAARSARI